MGSGFPSEVRGRVTSFGTFWVLWMNSPAVLICKIVCNQIINLPYYCGGEKILSPPAVSASRGERSRCPRGSDDFAKRHHSANTVLRLCISVVSVLLSTHVLVRTDGL